MGYRSSFLNIFIRVLILIAWILSFGYAYLKTDLIITPIMFGLLSLISVIELTWFLQRQERNWIRFLESIRYQDFNRIYQKKASKALGEAYELITQSMEELQSKNQSEYRLMQTLLGHISIGVMCFEENGNVIFTNKAFDALLDIPGLVNINKLKKDFSSIYEVMMQPETNSTDWVDHLNGQKLFVKTEPFKLREKNYTLVSLTDIRSSLETKELESYQKLMRVMTHEIMNSTNPILSLIRVINKKLINGNQLNILEDKDQRNTVKSLEAIETRTSGMLKFVTAYKEINKPIQPILELVKSDQLLSSISSLMDQTKGVQFEIKDKLNDDLYIDLSLIHQVLINLIQNAIEALNNIDNTLIIISIRRDSHHALIEVTDNGDGVPGSKVHQIFVPFYTTKSEGSGIGLALSRKIIKAHGGTLEYIRKAGQTQFAIRIPEKTK